MTSPPAISAQGISKRYRATAALTDFSLQVAPGTVHGLLGPNGAGKSTAVGILTTLRRPDAGAAEVAGFDVRTQGHKVRKNIGMVGQAHAVDEVLGGRQNLIMFARLAGLSARSAASRADELLERFDLTAAAGKPAEGYSGGMRRRLDIAISLLREPTVLFLDEPTTGLDPRGRNEVWRAVSEISGRGTAVLLTTQYLDEADRLAERISVLRGGTVIAEGTPADLKRSIGGDRLVVRIGPGGSLADAARIITKATGQDADTDAESRTVTAPAPDGTASTIRALRALDEHQLPIDDLELRRATLDDAFLALTEEAA